MAQEFRKNGAQAPGELEAMLQASGMSSDLIAQYLELGIMPISGGSGEGEGDGDGDAGDEGDSGDGDSSQAGNESDESGGKGGGETVSLEEAKRLRREAQTLRKRLKDAESKLESAGDEKLGELEKAQKDRDKAIKDYADLLGNLKSERVTSAALAAATKAGAIEPGVIAKLLDADAVDFDDELKPRNVAELVADVKKAHPKLFQAAHGSGNGGERDETRDAPKNARDRLTRAYGRKK